MRTSISNLAVRAEINIWILTAGRTHIIQLDLFKSTLTGSGLLGFGSVSTETGNKFLQLFDLFFFFLIGFFHLLDKKLDWIHTRNHSCRHTAGFFHNQYQQSVYIPCSGSKRSWETTMTVLSKLIRNSSSHSIAGRSRWLVGSSRSRISGLPKRAWARSTLTFILPVRSAICA